MKNFSLLTLMLVLLFPIVQPVSGHEVAASMAAAAKDFLNSLTEEQKGKASFELLDKERKKWAYVPKPFEGKNARKGVHLKEMSPVQRHLAYALLSTGLSHEGYTSALQIMSLEHVLWEIEQDAKRDTSMYYVTLFGSPGDKNWGWRFEGHHISMNFTIADDKVVTGTPVFFATNPAEVLQGPRKGLRVLAREEDVARKLAQSLTDEQKKTAVIFEKEPREILTAAKSKVQPLEGGGVAYPDLDDSQKKILTELMDVYIQRMRGEVADQEWTDIKKAGLDKVVFGWAGGYEKNQPHYYRVQGPTFLLEYANTQNGANHVHSVWRDFDGDFGNDLLRKHYADYHSEE